MSRTRIPELSIEMMASEPEDLLSLVVCQICKQDYKHPKQLVCLHTYCEPCLSAAVARRPTQYLSCPRCQRLTELCDDGVAGLPDDFKTALLVQFMGRNGKADVTKFADSDVNNNCTNNSNNKDSNIIINEDNKAAVKGDIEKDMKDHSHIDQRCSEDDQTPQCGVCRTPGSTLALCAHCQPAVYLCGACAQLHGGDPRYEHHVLQCGAHRQRLIVYCGTCGQACCGCCPAHSDHTVQHIQTEAGALRQTLLAGAQREEGDPAAGLTEVEADCQCLRQVQQQGVTYFQSVLERVSRDRAEFRALLEREARVLQQEKARRETAQRGLADLETLRSEVRTMADLELLQRGADLLQRRDQLLTRLSDRPRQWEPRQYRFKQVCDVRLMPLLYGVVRHEPRGPGRQITALQRTCSQRLPLQADDAVWVGGTLVLCDGARGLLCVITTTPRIVYEHTPRRLTVTPAGHLAYTCSRERCVRVLTLDERGLADLWRFGQFHEPCGLDQSAQGCWAVCDTVPRGARAVTQLMICGRDSRLVRFFPVLTCQSGAPRINHVRWITNDRLAVSHSASSMLGVWSVTGEQLVQLNMTVPSGVPTPPRGLCVTGPDTLLVCVGGWLSEIHLQGWQLRALLIPGQDGLQRAVAVCFNKDEDRVAVCDQGDCSLLTYSIQ